MVTFQRNWWRKTSGALQCIISARTGTWVEPLPFLELQRPYIPCVDPNTEVRGKWFEVNEPLSHEHHFDKIQCSIQENMICSFIRRLHFNQVQEEIQIKSNLCCFCRSSLEMCDCILEVHENIEKMTSAYCFIEMWSHSSLFKFI
jgi:hypothetical protein